MTDARTTRGIAQGIVSVAIAFVFAAILGACGDGASTGDAGDTTERDGSMEAAGTEHYVLPGEQVFPEGIAYWSDTGAFHVGSTTDGTVFRGNVEGDSKRTEVFLEPGTDGRKTATGMEVDAEGRLFIAGETRGRSSSTTPNRGPGSPLEHSGGRGDLPKRRGRDSRRRCLLHRLDAPGPLPGARHG